MIPENHEMIQPKNEIEEIDDEVIVCKKNIFKKSWELNENSLTELKEFDEEDSDWFGLTF